MSVLASVALTVVANFAPQGAQDPASRPAILSAAEQKSLRVRLVDFIVAEEKYEDADGIKARDTANRAREKAKDAFDKEWAAREKKGNLMASMADLRAIFDNCFLRKTPSMSLGQIRKETDKDTGFDYSVFVPRGYKPEVPMPAVILLPGTAEGKTDAWIEGRDYFAQTWDKSASSGTHIFHVPHPPNGTEMDPAPDLGIDADVQKEDKRRDLVFGTYRQTNIGLNIDRARVFLDCGRGACAFGLRFVSQWPERFAGIVLREPVTVDKIRLGTLTGMRVLMIKTAATATAIDTLKTQLDLLEKDNVTVIDATDAYPYKASTPQIEEWMQKQRRNMNRSRVVIEPNHDRFKKAYWVDPIRMDPLQTASADSKPRIEVTADRAANRIVVKAVGIEQYQLLLNDDIVDLDKEFTVVTNDKAVTQKLTRDFRRMYDLVRTRGDSDFLFTAMFQATVPKATSDGGGGGAK